MLITQRPIKVAILDLYDGYPNTEIKNLIDILINFELQHDVRFNYQVFDVRGKIEVPGIEFDIYLLSGGPGSPIDSEGSVWEDRYFGLIDDIHAHNQTDGTLKKHVLFICHSFQLWCRRLKLGKVNLRDEESFAVVPVQQTDVGQEPLFDGLETIFYAMDMREWQVVEPDEQRFAETGAKLVAIEPPRPDKTLPVALMAIRFNEYFFGTQFHPEVEPNLFKAQLLVAEKKADMLAEYGQQLYFDLVNKLDDPSKLARTHSAIIPAFLKNALGFKPGTKNNY